MATKKTGKRTRKTPAATPKTLAVPRRDGVGLMKTFGFTAPHKLTNEKLLMRLRKTNQYMEAFGGTLAGKEQAWVDAIIAAGDNISVEGEGPTAAKPTIAKAKAKPTTAKAKAKPTTAKAKAKPTTAKAKAKPTTAKAKATGGSSKLDRFGSRIGSKQAKVNAMLSRKPIRMKEIKDAVGGTFYSHLSNLIERKKVKKTSEGYALRLKPKNAKA